MINWKRLKVEATLKGRGPGETIKKKIAILVTLQ